MNADVTIEEIVASFPEDKSDALWTRFVLRPLSFPVAWLCIQLGLSANQVTYISILTVITGSALFLVESYPLAILAAILFNIFALLDCVDGNIARVSTESNPYGEWVDALGGYIAYTFLFVSAGVFVEATYGNLLGAIEIDFLLVGTVAAMSNLLMRTQHQKFENLREGPEDVSNDSSKSIKKEISRNLGLTGILMPVVLVGTLLAVLDSVLIFYAAFYTIAWVFVTLNRLQYVERA